MDIKKIVDSLDHAGLLAPPIDGIEVREQVVRHLEDLLEKDIPKTQGEDK